MQARTIVQVDGAASAEHEMTIAGRDKRDAGREVIALGRLVDRQRAEAIEAFGQRPGEAGWHVLNDQVRGARIVGQTGDDGAERAWPTGGGADDHQAIPRGARRELDGCGGAMP